MSRLEKYNKSLSKEWSIRIRTKHPDGDNYDGVITHVKSSFIVLREEKEFEFDGVIILPKRSIKSIRDGKFDKCCNEILRQNGQIKRLHPTRWLDSCETIADVIETLMKRDIWPGVETLSPNGKDYPFYIGPVIQTGPKAFSILGYDAAGRWEAEHELNYDEIFRIEFDSSYCKHFNKYMKLIEMPA